MVKMKMQVFLQLGNTRVVGSSFMEPINDHWLHFVGEADVIMLIVIVAH